MENRIILWFALLGLFFVLLIIRSFHFLVIESAQFTDLKNNNVIKKEIVVGSRGRIRDRNGSILAQDKPSVSIYLGDQQILEKDQEFLAKLAGVPIKKIQSLIEKKAKFKWLARQMPLLTLDELWKYLSPSSPITSPVIGNNRYFYDHGFGYVIEIKREYPYENLGSHLTGFTGVDNQGLSGLESFYDTVLKPKNSDSIRLVDVIGRTIKIVREVNKNDLNGKDIDTTLDIELTSKLSDILNSYKRVHDLSKVVVAVMDATSGELISSYSLPSYDPNNYRKYSAQIYNTNVLIHEERCLLSPLFLILTAAVLEQNMSDTSIMPAHFLDNLKSDILKPVTAKSIKSILGFSFNSKMFLKYCKNFGLGIDTGVDLPSEKAGDIDDPIATLLNSTGMTKMTALQAIRVTAIIVNNGIDVLPRIRQGHDNDYSNNKQKLLLNVTSNTIRSYLSGQEDALQFSSVNDFEYGGVQEYLEADHEMMYFGYVRNLGRTYVVYLSVGNGINGVNLEKIIRGMTKKIDYTVCKYIESNAYKK